jgi:hypothetical protein
MRTNQLKEGAQPDTETSFRPIRKKNKPTYTPTMGNALHSISTVMILE